MVKARRCVYLPIKTAWLATCIGTLVALMLVFRNLQAVLASTAMAAPKTGGFCLVSDYRAVNQQIKKYGPVLKSNEVPVALMTLPVHLGSKPLQEADDNHTAVLHFRVIQVCQNSTIPEPVIVLDIFM